LGDSCTIICQYRQCRFLSLARSRTCVYGDAFSGLCSTFGYYPGGLSHTPHALCNILACGYCAAPARTYGRVLCQQCYCKSVPHHGCLRYGMASGYRGHAGIGTAAGSRYPSLNAPRYWAYAGLLLWGRHLSGASRRCRSAPRRSDLAWGCVAEKSGTYAKTSSSEACFCWSFRRLWMLHNAHVPLCTLRFCSTQILEMPHHKQASEEEV
jgi:hypothetical protein